MKHLAGILALAAVILISNAVVLIGIARNRSGEPIQMIELTERELPLQSMGQDNSGITLRLNWTNRLRNPEQMRTSFEDYFDQAKLEELGFRLEQPSAMKIDNRRPLPREAFAAFEYEGDSWQRWLKKTNENREKAALQNQKDTGPNSRPPAGDPAKRERMASRLFLVDAGRSYDQLRRKYPDRQKYVIVRAVIRVTLDNSMERRADQTASPQWHGYVADILPEEIFVPAPYAQTLSRLAGQSSESPRYAVTLRYGRKLEPWIADVKLKMQ